MNLVEIILFAFIFHYAKMKKKKKCSINPDWFSCLSFLCSKSSDCGIKNFGFKLKQGCKQVFIIPYSIHSK